MMTTQRTLLIGLVLIASLASTLAWGRVGHETIGQITDRIMDPTARKTVLAFFNDDEAGESIARASIWADKVDHDGEFPWSARLHYANIPDWKCAFQYDRDCVDHGCVVGAIVNYSTRAQDTKLSEEDRIDALKWLIHFVEDIHQPLHISFGSDRGGNSFKGRFFNSKMNLHSVWDEGLIHHRIMTDFTGGDSSGLNVPYEEYLENMYKKSKPSKWGACKFDANLRDCISGWATEAAQYACEYAYTDVNGDHIATGFDLGEDYYKRSLPVMEIQLVKGSYRLSMLLDSLFPRSSRSRTMLGPQVA